MVHDAPAGGRHRLGRRERLDDAADRRQLLLAAKERDGERELHEAVLLRDLEEGYELRVLVRGGGDGGKKTALALDEVLLRPVGALVAVIGVLLEEFGDDRG